MVISRQENRKTTVAAVLEHIKELDEKFDENQYDDTCRTLLKDISEGIVQLELECQTIQENGEAKSIEASSLRHRFQIFPEQIENELNSAVESARNSNIEELTSLQTSLNKIQAVIKDFKDRHLKVEKENSAIEPEKNEVMEKHEDIVGQLNERMALKASKQIKLNNTRERLRDSLQEIIDIEDEIAQMKEDMIQERADAKQEKLRLKQAIAKRNKDVNDERRVNIYKRREIETLSEHLMESESKLQSKRTVVARHEKAKDEAIAREKHLSSMLSQKITENNELREKGQGITRNHENMIRDFERQQAKLKEERDILQEELRQVTEEQKKLVQHHKSHRAVLQDIVQQRDGEDATLKEVQSLVRDTRDRFTKVSDELSRLKDESINLDNRMNRLMEDHKATVEVLGRQIEQTRTSLNSERKERQELQNDRDVLQKKIDNLKREHGNFMSEVTSRITRGKEKYLQQTQKKEETNRLVGETEKTAKNKQQQLEKAQQAYNEMTADLGGKVKEGEDQINRYRQELQNVQKATEAEQPLYQEREKIHKEKQELLDKMKKKVVALKKEQQLLQQEITETKEKIEDCKEPRTQLEEELGIRKNDYNNFLKKAGEEMSQCEEDIYVTTSKLDVIMEENERLDNAMNKLQANLDRVNYAIEEKNNLFRAMTNRKEHITTTLKDAWAKDRNMDVKFAIRDTDTVAEITDFENGMQERGEELQGIQSLIEGELDNLTQFLENLRPYNKDGDEPGNKRTHHRVRQAKKKSHNH